MGVSDEGQLGSGFDLDYTAIPERIPGILADAASVALGDGHACALNRQGGVQCWGAGSRGQLGVRDWYDPWKAGRLAPLAATLHPPRAGEEAGTAAAGGSEGPKSAGLASGARSPTQAGWKMPEELDADEENGRISRVPLTVDGLATGAMQVAAGAAHSCAVTSRGQLRCWGSNAFGQIGDGSRTTRISPVVVSGLETGVMQVALGAAHSCALMSDRSVRCWGTNARGELGDGSGEEHLTPVEVKGLGAPVSRLSVGAFHSCALLSTGVVKCWGYNRSGQLGDGSGANSLLPVTVKGLPAKITQLAAGAAHTCALDEAGDLYCWGSNAQGQLGNGLSGERNNALTAVQALDPGFGAASR